MSMQFRDEQGNPTKLYKSMLEVLKLVLVVAGAGGGAALAITNFVVDSKTEGIQGQIAQVQAAVNEHTKDGTIHPEDARRITRVEQSAAADAKRAADAAENAQNTAARVEAATQYNTQLMKIMVKEMGVPAREVPPEPTPPKASKSDAGSPQPNDKKTK